MNASSESASASAVSDQESDADRDLAAVTQLLGRRPKTLFTVVIRNSAGTPVVTKNAPFEHDGTPMPTRYWLLPSSRAAVAIGRLESSGGVREVESVVDAAEIEAAHRRYADDRDADIPEGWTGHRPSGGVGGTRAGTKCLHAHYAYFLAGGDDPVGRWVWDKLTPAERDRRVIEPAACTPKGDSARDSEGEPCAR